MKAIDGFIVRQTFLKGDQHLRMKEQQEHKTDLPNGELNGSLNGDSATPKYKIGAVSRLTGLSSDVVRVWERRYSAITPRRSDGGSRLYSDADVSRLRKLRQAVEMGHAIGQVAKLSESELETLSVKHRAAYPSAEETADPYATTCQRFLEAISRMNVIAADEELHRAATLFPPRVLVKKIVSPLLNEIGERWAHKEFGIAHEHVATNLIRNLLSSLFRLYPPDDGAEAVVFATPTGERHEFGILLGALIAATHGWRTIYLGTDLPAVEIVRTVKLAGARLLAMSLVSTQEDSLGSELQTIHETMPARTRVWIAGAEAMRRRDFVERANWILIRDFDDLDDRLKR